MSSLYNPVFLGKIAASYLSDVDRVWRLSEEEIRKYQDKCLRKVVKYAYDVPLYHKKYKEAGVHPSDIKGVKDIEKLPFITKNDLRENYPNNIIPKGFDRKNGFLLSTSGSTGRPVFVYYDLFSSIKSLEGLVRELKAYGGNWRKSKVVLVVDLSPGSIEHTVFAKSAMPFLKKFLSLKNIKYLDFGEKPEVLMQEINDFKPEFIGSDPNILRKLAFLKKDGCGKDIKPKYIISSAAMLDGYTKNYVENAFDARVLDAYGSTETGPVAFECTKGDYYHVHSDFVCVEFLDEEKKPVDFGKSGRIVVTKLYGKGTPMIRYTGLDDLAVPMLDRCSCGINSQLIRRIEGRSTDLIVLPDGKMMTPFTITGIPAEIMKDFKIYKIKQFQIIQHKTDEIEILVVIDDKLRNVGLPTERLLEELKRRFSEKVGNDVKIIVNEIGEIKKDEKTGNIKVVISKVKKNTA